MTPQQTDELLIRVTAPHFVAGVIVREARIAEAAPILRRLIGHDGRTFATVCRRYGWTWEVLNSPRCQCH